MCISLITLVTALLAGATSGIVVERFLAKRGYKPKNHHATLFRQSPRVIGANR
ncbi:MAG: hypothetical protein ACRCYY_16715 [Trueperaceae bacterium]